VSLTAVTPADRYDRCLLERSPTGAGEIISTATLRKFRSLSVIPDRGAKTASAKMKGNSSAITVIGIDMGKNSSHIVGHDQRGAIPARPHRIGELA
jgi:hypothetical protein